MGLYGSKIILGRVLALSKRYRTTKNEIYNLLKAQLKYEPTEEQVFWCLGDYYLYKKMYNGWLEGDYFKTQIYRKSDFVRMDSLASGIKYKWREALYDSSVREIFVDKEMFYKNFSEYLNRKWLIVNNDVSFEKIVEFIKSCNYEIVAKEPKSWGGKGVQFYSFKDNKESIEKFYKHCVKNHLVIEEKLVQCDEIKSFSSSSVNTFRIITIVDKYGNPHIGGAVFRLGRGNSNLDNFSSGGMAAQIDLKTGIVYTPAKDKDGREYILHPDTNKQIVGYKISDWEQYRTFALELALKFPTMRYVGWDIIKNNDGKYCIIEGNDDAGIAVMECQLMYGLKPYWDALLDGKELR